MLDSHLDETFEECDGMLWNQLLERYQESSLESDTTTDRCEVPFDIACHSIPDHIDPQRDHIANDTHDTQELRKFPSSPRSLQVLPSIKESSKGNN